MKTHHQILKSSNQPMPETTTKPAETQMPPVNTKQYARYTMVAFYKAPIAAKKGRPKQTFRDDYTISQYITAGDEVLHFHPLHVLMRKFHELKYQFTSAVFYDNYIKKSEAVNNQRILRITIVNGVEDYSSDMREDYYDTKTGLPYPYPINDAQFTNKNL